MRCGKCEFFNPNEPCLSEMVQLPRPVSAACGRCEMEPPKVLILPGHDGIPFTMWPHVNPTDGCDFGQPGGGDWRDNDEDDEEADGDPTQDAEDAADYLDPPAPPQGVAEGPEPDADDEDDEDDTENASGEPCEGRR